MQQMDKIQESIVLLSYALGCTKFYVTFKRSPFQDTSLLYVQ